MAKKKLLVEHTTFHPDGRIELCTPKSWFFKRALGILLGIPFLSALLGVLMIASLLDDVADPAVVVTGVGGLVVLASLGGALAGAIRLFKTAGKSRASLVRIDPRLGTLESASGTVSLDSVGSLELYQPSRIVKWRAIRAKVATGQQGDSPYRSPGTQSVTLLANIEPKASAQALELLEQLGERLDKPVSVAKGAASTSPFGGGGKEAAMCYIPVQGLWLIFSGVALARSEETLVRFHAKQSLLIGLGHLFVVIGGVAIAGVGFELLNSELVGALGLIGMFFALMLLFVLRLVAMYKGSKEQLWSPLGMRWLTERWKS